VDLKPQKNDNSTTKNLSDEQKLKKLTELGFSEEDALDALFQSSGNLENATEFLLSKSSKKKSMIIEDKKPVNKDEAIVIVPEPVVVKNDKPDKVEVVVVPSNDVTIEQPVVANDDTAKKSGLSREDQLIMNIIGKIDDDIVETPVVTTDTTSQEVLKVEVEVDKKEKKKKSKKKSSEKKRQKNKLE